MKDKQYIMSKLVYYNRVNLDNQQKRNEYMTEEDYVEATNSLSI